MALNLKKRNLADYDLEVFVDISGSTSIKDTPSGLSRLDDCRKTVSTLVEACETIDTDGVTVGFFNADVTTYENTTFAKVAQLFAKTRAGGGTDTAKVLQERIGDYFDKRFGKPASGLFGKAQPANPSTKPRIIVIITDGEPNIPSERQAQQAVRDVIVNATKRLVKEGLDRKALGISFIQTGRDMKAKVFLEELNNGLVSKHGAALDIVNCLTVDDCDGLATEQILEKALDD